MTAVIILGINIVLIGIGIPAWISIPLSIACCLPAFESKGNDSTPIPKESRKNNVTLKYSTDPVRHGESDPYDGEEEWCDLE